MLTRSESPRKSKKPKPPEIEDPGLEETIKKLAELQVLRLYYIRHTKGISTSVGALVRRHLGWSWKLKEESPKKAEEIRKRAAQIASRAISGKAQDREDKAIAAHYVAHLNAAVRMYEIAMEQRTLIEMEMETRAKHLPVYDWAMTIDGIGPRSLAIVIAEGGDPTRFAKKKKYWKWFGFAPFTAFNGVTKAPSTWMRASGGKASQKLTTEEWVKAKHSPRRQGEIYGSVTVPLRNKQVVGKTKTGDGEREYLGPYGKVYLERLEKMTETSVGKTAGQIEKDASRVMTQAFLSDLWTEWKRHAESDRRGLDKKLATAKEKPKRTRSRTIDQPGASL